MGFIDIAFISLTTLIYPREDNCINSFFGLLYIFNPIANFMLSLIALTTELHITSGTDEENLLLGKIVIGYMILMLSSVMQTILVCYLIGITRKNDSAYQGLIERQIC